MSFSDYSTTPSDNTTINGINVAENCPAGNVNNAIRQLMADGKELSANVPDASAYLLKSGGTMTGNINRSGAGTHAYYASGSFLSFKVHLVPEGSTRPTGLSNGDWVAYYE